MINSTCRAMQITIRDRGGAPPFRKRPVLSLFNIGQVIVVFLVLNVQLCHSHCALNEFTCEDKSCIPMTSKCNGKFDCPDKTDEREICSCDESSGNVFNCEGSSDECIFNSQKCDGYNDCRGGEDEKNCREQSLNVTCATDEWLCKDGLFCIKKLERCDNVFQCFDKSDEDNCAGHQCAVFHCHNGRCLPELSYQCDGKDDCGDNSDEFHCVTGCTLDHDLFLCNDNSSCLPLSRTCDGINDCVDGSDETLQCKRETCKTLECPSKKCVQLPSGPTCHCGKGFALNAASQTCEDVNECRIYGMCSQTCKNTEGSYQCGCVEGFNLSSADKSTCVTNSNESSWIYFSAKTSIHRHNVEKNYVEKLEGSLEDVLGIAADSEYVYWSTIASQKQAIYRRNVSGYDRNIIALNGVGLPEGLAVDWWTDNLYFTDSLFSHIAVCGHFQTRCMALITHNLYKPRGLAVHPPSARIFWTDWGLKPHIGVAYMDGKEQRVFADENIHWPNGISIDYPANRIYWVDAKLGTLTSLTLDGKDRQSFEKREDWHAFNIEVLGGRIYWTEKFHHTINSVDQFTGKNPKSILKVDSLRSLYAHHSVIHRPLQNDSHNPCHQHHCPELCLLAKDGGYSCACSEDGTMSGTVCKDNQNKILIGYDNTLFEFTYVKIGVPTIFPLANRVHSLKRNKIDRLAFNLRLNEIFIADNGQQKILRMKLSFFSMATTLVDDGIGRVTSMAVDPNTNNLYWTDSIRNTIEMISVDTLQRVTLHFFGSDFEPMSMVLALSTGKIFVAGNRSPVKIYQLSMNGMSVTSYLQKWSTKMKVEVALTIDEDSSQIYVALGDKIIAWRYDRNIERRHRSGLHEHINQMAWMPGADRYFWTAGDGQIYWDSSMGAIDKSMQIPVEGGGSHSPETIPIVHYRNKGIVIPHPCMENNGGCSDICVSLGVMHTCLCGAARIFKSRENRTCIPQVDCEFKCHDGMCITAGRVCNGRRDCADNSDEEFCHSHEMSANHFTCSYDEFKCFDGSACLDMSQKCDQHFDCNDHSDELHCETFNLTTRCHHHQFLCNNTAKCVDMTGLCDEFDDCDDGSDETMCLLPKAERPSCGDLYDCGNGQCIDKAWICDHEFDCVNDEDEAKCDYTTSPCPMGFFECDDDSCIHMSMRCDGHPDCLDNMDEHDCPKKNDTQSTEECDGFECASDRSICLSYALRCDRHPDCPRGEDEKNCSLCSPDQFECKSHGGELTEKWCVDLAYVCDREKDCGDGSDEVNCDHPPATVAPTYVHCPPNSFHCNSGECISMSKVCDSSQDCQDGSDEGGDCNKQCKKNSCSQECIRMPTGPKCGCQAGFVLDADGRTCSDFNECLYHPCMHRCENKHGSFECSCFPGFMLTTNKQYCKAMGPSGYILYTSSNHLRKMTASQYILKKEVLKTLLPPTSNLAVDIERDVVYATSADLVAIIRLDLKTTKLKFRFTDAMNLIAVDWVTGNLYVHSNAKGDKQIRICNFESKRCVKILNLEADNEVKHIELDGRDQLVFFTETIDAWSSGAQYTVLFKMRSDGMRKEIVRKFLSHWTFTVDVNKRMIYFVDPHEGTIQEVNYQGDQERTLARGLKDTMSGGGVSSMAIFEGRVILGLVGKPFLVTCQMTHLKDNCYTTFMDVTNVNQLTVVQRTVQPHVENVCENHRCSRICVATDRGPKCLCQGGMQVGQGEECLSVEGDKDIDLYPIGDHVISALSETDLEPSYAGRVVLIVLFILCGLAGLTMYAYRKRYLMSTFTISHSFTNVGLETSPAVKDLPPVMYKPNIHMDPENQMNEITFDEKETISISSRTSKRSLVVSSTVSMSDESIEFSDATHLVK